MENTSFGTEEPQDAAYWARHVTSLQVGRVPTGALNLNVDGRQVVGPLQGFGQMWQKTYTVRLTGVAMTPAEVIKIWKTHFTRFQPAQNHFYPLAEDVEPGAILLINAELSGMPVSTGVMVLYADEESFTLMTPQGHPESGWITFSAEEDQGCVTCQIQSIARANDPLYELGFRLFGSHAQEQIWVHVLKSLAAYFSVEGQVQITKICVDTRVQWSEAKNIWQNAAIRTTLYMLASPYRWFARVFKSSGKRKNERV